MKMLAVLVLALIVNPTFSFECGLANKDPSSARIVGGKSITFLKYPWFASLHLPRNKKQLYCAGALISPEFVLTAAHCYPLDLGIPNEGLYHVTLGIYDRCMDNVDAPTYKTSNVYIHDKYMFDENTYTPENDIAVLKLDGASTLMPVCLPPKGTPIKYVENAEIVGFGRQNEDADAMPCEINEASVEIFTAAQCQKESRLPPKITNKMRDLQTSFCAGKMSGGIDTCQGDSGGSILVLEKDRYFSRGIVSYGYGCGAPNLPGVYANVASYIDWINSTMRGELKIYQASSSRKTPQKPSMKKTFRAVG